MKNSKGIFQDVLNDGNDEAAAPVRKSNSPHLRKVGDSVTELQQRSDELDRLLKDAAHIVEVDPDSILPSTIADRFDGAYERSAIEQITASMRERGQVVPGMIRPHGKSYQIVFGRRRLAAAKELGIKFKAIVRELSDEEAIVLQGEENTNRNELSFIERCAFAVAQIQAGFTRDVVCNSLSVTKPRLSEMLIIGDTLPRELLNLIGAAPNIGRRRWQEFAEAWKLSAQSIEAVSRTLDTLGSKDDDVRFAAVLAAIKTGGRNKAREPLEIRSNGLLLATAVGTKLTLSKGAPAGFMDFLTSKMEELHAEYMRMQTKG